jgi:hypothetical protein
MGRVLPSGIPAHKGQDAHGAKGSIMSTDQTGGGSRGVLSTLGLILLPILCCALPLLIVAGALGGIGTVLGNPWVISGAGALLVGLLVWALHRRRTGRKRRSG